MYQVVASDLDGTLLSPDHTLSPYAKETLKLLTARGINFVFATGRHHVDVGQIRDNLEIKSYMITSNGARVHDLDGNLIFAHNLDRDIASDLFGVVNDNPDIITNVYRDDEWFMNRHRPEEMRFFKEAVFKYALYEPGLLEPEGVSKVFFTCDSHEQLLPLEQAINARWGDRVNVSFSTLTSSLSLFNAFLNRAVSASVSPFSSSSDTSSFMESVTSASIRWNLTFSFLASRWLINGLSMLSFRTTAFIFCSRNILIYWLC